MPFDDAVFAHGLFGLRGEVLQRGGEILAGGLVVGSAAERRCGAVLAWIGCELAARDWLVSGWLRLARMPSVLLRLRRRCWIRSCGRWFRRTRLCLSGDLALVRGGCGPALADCWSESFGCGGPTLASELGQSQLPDVLQKPASNGNSSTIATPRKQCQTQICVLRECCTCARLSAVQSSYEASESSFAARPSATLPLAMDYLWTPWRYAYVSSTEKTADASSATP